MKRCDYGHPVYLDPGPLCVPCEKILVARPVMVIRCGWCQVVMGVRKCEARDAARVSHGICRTCFSEVGVGMAVTPEMEAEWVELEKSLEEDLV